MVEKLGIGIKSQHGCHAYVSTRLNSVAASKEHAGGVRLEEQVVL